MSINPLNDISRVYLEQVVESSHLETDMKKRREANEKAIQDMKKTKAHKDMVATIRKKFDEALDPVGQEDADIDNDGDTDKSDKYLHKRRKAIGKAISKRSVKEGFSNWRQDLSEVMDDSIDSKPIKEKKVNNKVKINPELKEAVEEIGGTLIEMVEIDEMDYILESVYEELLEEGYEEDDIEDAIEYSLTEAKVTFGHDTASPSTSEKKRRSLMTAAKARLSSLKKSAKQAVATGARKVAKGALGVARKVEGGNKKPHTAERKPSTYRGAGAGQKERVSSGSYTPPTKKKAEPISDPWEGSATTPKSKTKTKKTVAPKAKTTATKPRKKKSDKLDALLSNIRNEQVQIDEKVLSKMEMKKREELVKSMKKNQADFEKRYPGRGKEVMYATATKMAKKMAEQALELQPKQKEKPLDTASERQKYANLKMVQQKQQQLQKQKLNLQKQGKLPLETESFEVIDERRKEDKVAGTPRKPRDRAFELVAKSMGSSRMGVQPRGQKKVPGKKPPAAGEYGGPVSPAQKVAKRRADAQRAKDMMHSRFD